MIGSRSLQHKDVADATLDIHWDHIIWLFNLLELWMNEGFIKIKHKSFLSTAMVWLRPKEAIISSEPRLGTK